MMRRNAGFTLLEILVAIAVLGLLLSLLGQGISFGLRASDLQARAEIEAGTEVSTAENALRRLIEAADPGIFPEPASLAGSGTSLTLLTRAAAADGTWQRIDAEIDAGGGHLRLRWRPHRHVAPFGPTPPLEETVLLDGVTSLRIGYAAPGREAWQSAWTGTALPALVRLEIGFASARRHWPPIVVAPKLEPLGE